MNVMKKKPISFKDHDLDVPLDQALYKLINPYKVDIMNIVFNEGEKTISELQRMLGISYKETYRHVSELAEIGVIKREKRIKEKHAPVYVSLRKKRK